MAKKKKTKLSMFYVRYREERSFGTIEHGEFYKGKSVGEALSVFGGTPAFSDRVVTEVFLVGKDKNGRETFTKIKVDGLS